jgi:hypothetical protein
MFFSKLKTKGNYFNHIQDIYQNNFTKFPSEIGNETRIPNIIIIHCVADPVTVISPGKTVKRLEKKR